MSLDEQKELEQLSCGTLQMQETPGHLVRRCHQIAVAIFLDEFRDFPITPVQYSALIAIHDYPGLDQNALASLITVDRTTVGGVLKGLEKRNFVARIVPLDNLRVKRLFILADGDRFLQQTRYKLSHTRQRLLGPLSDAEKEIFVALLTKLVQSDNDASRAA